LLQVRDQVHYEVLQAARQRQKTELFKTQYAARAGIEGTISQGTRTSDLWRSRYIGLPKTRLLHRAGTRQSAFTRLALAAS
jgi:transposase